MDNLEYNNQEIYLKTILNKLNYEQLEQILIKQSKENLILKELLMKMEEK